MARRLDRGQESVLLPVRHARKAAYRVEDIQPDGQVGGVHVIMRAVCMDTDSHKLIMSAPQRQVDVEEIDKTDHRRGRGQLRQPQTGA